MLKAFKVLKLALTTFLLSLTFLSADNLESASIATLDQDRLYRSSLFGQRVLQEINDKSDKLLANELLLQSELESEEQALTEKRTKIDIEEFKETYKSQMGGLRRDIAHYIEIGGSPDKPLREKFDNVRKMEPHQEPEL